MGGRTLASTFYMWFNQSNHLLPQGRDFDRRLIALIVLRAIVLLLWLNLAHRLELLPERLGSFPFLPSFNIVVSSLTLIYLIVWFGHRYRMLQLYFQVGADLGLATVLVANTQGIESSFVSFYLLIIIYCSLTLGRNGGMFGAALSTILYAGAIIGIHLGFSNISDSKMNTPLAAFKISAHALGFWAVAYLGTYLHRRLRLMENELREKIDSLTQLQRLNEHIVSSIRSGLITTDLQGRIAAFNAAARELTGRDSEETIGKSIQLIIGENLWNQIQNADLLQNARALRHEEWIKLPSGAKRFLGFSVSPLLGADHKLLGFIISFQDLTEIMRLEEEVRLKDRMAAIGRMAAGIAHEIRNPLTAMRGSVEVLQSRANLPEKDERLLRILIRESDRLNKFIEDFLNFARPRTYSKQVLDLIPVLRDSVTLLKNSPEIRERYSVNLNIEAQSMRILGSADQLNQVFWNLAQNAIRAMPNGGELTISIKKTAEGVGQVVFQDSGIGMSREEIEQIIQPFHSGFPGGLGLGLSIIFQIMEDHQSKISFESEKGNGTKVILIFPIESGNPLRDPERANQIARG